MSTEKNKFTSVIVVKRVQGHEGSHGGAWKVAYADFVTAMMAFFLVMWIAGQNPEVKENVASYFLDPVGYSEKIREGILTGGGGVMQEGGTEGVLDKNSDAVEAIKAMLEKAEQEISNAIQKTPDLEKFSQLIKVELVNEGLRVELQESNDSTFFDLGSADLSPDGLDAMKIIGTVIASLDMNVAVEGHTDSRPFGSGKGPYSNWELSTDRANAARRSLTDSGVDPKRIIEIRGYADTRLKYPDSPYDPRNRRITITVFKPEIAQEPEPEQKSEVFIEPADNPDSVQQSGNAPEESVEGN